MARITVQQLKRVEKQRNSIHEKVMGTYTVFEKDGNRYFQIDTYGKEDREIPEKISQSIQISSDDAKNLIELLINELGY